MSECKHKDVGDFSDCEPCYQCLKCKVWLTTFDVLDLHRDHIKELEQKLAAHETEAQKVNDLCEMQRADIARLEQQLAQERWKDGAPDDSSVTPLAAIETHEGELSIGSYNDVQGVFVSQFNCQHHYIAGYRIKRHKPINPPQEENV